MIELISEYKNQGEWKVQLTAEVNFISLKPGSDEIRIMHVRSDSEEFMSGDDTNEIILIFISIIYTKIRRKFTK